MAGLVKQVGRFHSNFLHWICASARINPVITGKNPVIAGHMKRKNSMTATNPVIFCHFEQYKTLYEQRRDDIEVGRLSQYKPEASNAPR